MSTQPRNDDPAPTKTLPLSPADPNFSEDPIEGEAIGDTPKDQPPISQQRVRRWKARP